MEGAVIVMAFAKLLFPFILSSNLPVPPAVRNSS